MKNSTQAPPRWMYVLPNMFTLGSLFAGFYAITLLTSGQLESEHFLYAAAALMIATVCDLLDGRVARMTRTQSEFGLHMDSLVDLVSFGLAPALLVYKWSLHEFGVFGMVIAFAFAGCGACRLARFNVIELSGKENKQPGASRYFVGLPIPLAAGMLISVIVLLEAMQLSVSTWGIAGLSLLLAVLMVSNVRFRTFKDIKMSPQTIAVFALVIAFLTSAAMYTGQPALSLVMLFASYVLGGLFGELFGVWHRITNRVRVHSK